MRRRPLSGVTMITMSLLWSIGAGGCSSGKSSDALERQLEAAMSASATSQLAVESWLANRVPTAYATRTLEEQHAALDKAATAIESITPRDVATTSAAHATRRASAAAQMRDMLERHDTSPVRARLEQLTASAAELRCLRDRAKRAGGAK